MSNKLNIFNILHHIDIKNHELWNSLSESEQKQIVPFLLMKWLFSSNDSMQVIFLNECVNPYAFVLSNHKRLLLDLMMICTSGKPQQYTWNKTKTVYNKLKLDIIKQYFNYSAIQAEQVLLLLTNDQIKQMGFELGYQECELKQL